MKKINFNIWPIKFFIIGLLIDTILTQYGIGRWGVEAELNPIALILLKQPFSILILGTILYAFLLIKLAQFLKYPYGTYLLYKAGMVHIILSLSWLVRDNMFNGFHNWLQQFIFVQQVVLIGIMALFIIKTFKKQFPLEKL